MGACSSISSKTGSIQALCIDLRFFSIVPSSVVAAAGFCSSRCRARKWVASFMTLEKRIEGWYVLEGGSKKRFPSIDAFFEIRSRQILCMRVDSTRFRETSSYQSIRRENAQNNNNSKKWRYNRDSSLPAAMILWEMLVLDGEWWSEEEAVPLQYCRQQTARRASYCTVVVEQYCTVRYSTVLYCTVQHCTVRDAKQCLFGSLS